MVAMAPFSTIVFDKYGKRCFYLMMGFIFVLTGHLFFYSLPQCGPRETCRYSILPLVLLGIGSSMIKLTLLTNLVLVTREKFYGQAFGMYLIFANLGVIIGSLTIGYMVDRGYQPPRKYGDVNLLFACLSSVGLVVSTHICYKDEVNNGLLNAAIHYENNMSPAESSGENTDEERKDTVEDFLELDQLPAYKNKSKKLPLIFVKEN